MRVLFGRVVHGEEDAECGRWWLFIYLFIIYNNLFIYIYIYIYIIFLIRVANLHTYTISNMQYFNTIITRKKVQKKN